MYFIFIFCFFLVVNRIFVLIYCNFYIFFKTIKKNTSYYFLDVDAESNDPFIPDLGLLDDELISQDEQILLRTNPRNEQNSNSKVSNRQMEFIKKA